MNFPKASRIRDSRFRIGAALVAIETVAMSIGLTFVDHAACAQTSEVVAESLFRDGKRLFQSDDFEHACPKLAQSYQIDPAGGTALLLAICYEKQGKLASSWARYNDALALAKHDQREDRERRAREGLESVEPKLSYIDLKLDPVTQAIAKLTLSIDGTELPVISDARFPIDAGKHKLAIRAPNYESWQTEVTVGGPSATESVSVPPLQAKPVAEPTAAAAQPVRTEAFPNASESSAHERAHNKNIRTMAYVMGGAGLAAVAVGSYFGVRAIVLKNDANAICSSKQCTQAQAAAVPKSDDAISNAHMADALIGIGSALTISAAIMWYLYRDDPSASAPYAAMTPHAVSLGWRQSF